MSGIFSALGDGVTDDTVAIQAALNSGHPVYLPEGTYKTTGLVISRDTTVLRGAGRGKTVLQGVGTSPILTITAGYPDLRDFSLNGTPTQTPYGIFFDTNGGIQGTFRDLDIANITGAPGYGIGNTLHGYSTLFDRLRISGCNIGLHLIRNIQNTIIDHCLIYQNKVAQIVLGNGVGTSRMISIMNSEIEGGGNPGQDVMGIIVNQIEPLTIINCYFESFDSLGSADIQVLGALVGTQNRLTFIGCYSNANIVARNAIKLDANCGLSMEGCYYFNNAPGGDTIENHHTLGRVVTLRNSVLNVNGGVSTGF